MGHGGNVHFGKNIVRQKDTQIDLLEFFALRRTAQRPVGSEEAFCWRISTQDLLCLCRVDILFHFWGKNTMPQDEPLRRMLAYPEKEPCMVVSDLIRRLARKGEGGTGRNSALLFFRNANHHLLAEPGESRVALRQ